VDHRGHEMIGGNVEEEEFLTDPERGIFEATSFIAEDIPAQNMKGE